MYPKRFNPVLGKSAPALHAPEEQLSCGPEDKLEVLSHARNLNGNLQSLLQDVKDGTFRNFESAITAIQQDVAGFEDYLSKTIEAEYYAEYQPPNGTATAKALAIPELLENVLSNLKAPDLMQFYGVNRIFRDVLERSEKLQIRLFLKPDPNGNRTDFPFDSKYIHYRVMSGNIIQIYFNPCAGSSAILPTVGSRWKQMLISQPTVRKIHYRLMCKHTSPVCSSPFQTVSLDEDLTINDLYEAAKSILEQYSNCAQDTSAAGGSKGGHEVIFQNDHPGVRLRLR